MLYRLFSAFIGRESGRVPQLRRRHRPEGRVRHQRRHLPATAARRSGWKPRRLAGQSTAARLRASERARTGERGDRLGRRIVTAAPASAVIRASENPLPGTLKPPESFERQLGDRVNKRLKSPRA